MEILETTMGGSDLKIELISRKAVLERPCCVAHELLPLPPGTAPLTQSIGKSSVHAGKAETEMESLKRNRDPEHRHCFSTIQRQPLPLSHSLSFLAIQHDRPKQKPPNTALNPGIFVDDQYKQIYKSVHESKNLK